MDFKIYDEKVKSKILPKFIGNTKMNDPSFYKAGEGLIDAINVALNTGLPLLLTGEPGTGKTQLAYHLAYYFGLGKPLVYNITTTTTAKDLFYRYEALRHFEHVQSTKKRISYSTIENKFIKYNALGEAIRANSRKIVLLDEIDKASRDLPNDILFALEDLSFEIPEIDKKKNRRIKTDQENRPIIIMTSNSEKNLPKAFLRRVVYYHIPFPNEETLVHILSAKLTKYKLEDLHVISRQFEEIRNLAENKKPATAELIYWTYFLEQFSFPVIKLLKTGDCTEEEKRYLIASYSLLCKDSKDLQKITKLKFPEDNPQL